MHEAQIHGNSKTSPSVDKIKIDLLIHEAKCYLMEKKHHTMKQSWSAESERLFQCCVPFTAFTVLLKYHLRYYSVVAKYSVMVLSIAKQAKLKNNTDAVSFPVDEWVGLLCRCTSNGVWKQGCLESALGSPGLPSFSFFFHGDAFIPSLLPLVVTELGLLAIVSVPRGVSSLANSDGWHHALHPYGH